MTTAEIIRRTQVALAYLEDGARETGLIRIQEIADENRAEIENLKRLTESPVTLREHPDAADNTVADACEHCGLFSCCGECLDDAPHGNCACGKALDSNGEHGGGYGAFCGGPA